MINAVSTTSESNWATDQALAILAVDDIHPSQDGIALMRAMDQGSVTYEQAIAAILDRAKRYANPTV